MSKLTLTKQGLEDLVAQSKCRADILTKLGCGKSGKNFKKLDGMLLCNGTSTSHFICKKNKKKLDKFLTKDIALGLVDRHGTVKDICNELNVNYTHYNKFIRDKLSHFGLKLDVRKIDGNWKAEEDKIVLENYANLSTDELMSLLPGRTWVAIKLRSEKLGLKSIKRGSFNRRRFFNFQKESNLSKLLEDNNLAYYWLGFLMADGHFSENRLILCLSLKDVNHLRKYANFIETSSWQLCEKGNKCTVSVMDSMKIPMLRSKFLITNRKTYEPSNIESIKDDDLFVSLAIGFIDGDGCIKHQTGRSDCAIHIKCHSSWLNNLQLISDRICLCCKTKPNRATINSKGYAKVSFTNSIVLNFLKNKIKELNLPVLERKWGLIDEYRKNKLAVADSGRAEIKRLYDSGKSIKEIRKTPGLNYAFVCKAIRELTKTDSRGILQLNTV